MLLPHETMFQALLSILIAAMMTRVIVGTTAQPHFLSVEHRHVLPQVHAVTTQTMLTLTPGSKPQTSVSTYPIRAHRHGFLRVIPPAAAIMTIAIEAMSHRPQAARHLRLLGRTSETFQALEVNPIGLETYHLKARSSNDIVNTRSSNDIFKPAVNVDPMGFVTKRVNLRANANAIRAMTGDITRRLRRTPTGGPRTDTPETVAVRQDIMQRGLSTNE